MNNHPEIDTKPDPKQRLQRIDIRVNSQEYTRIKARAQNAGLTASAYVRRRALSDKDARVVEIDAAVLAKAFADLKRAGSNVNQIARVLNIHGPKAVPISAIESALARLGDAAELVSTTLSIIRNQ